MPSQLVKESAIEARVGPQIKIRSRASGIPTMNTSSSLSWRVSSE